MKFRTIEINDNIFFVLDAYEKLILLKNRYRKIAIEKFHKKNSSRKNTHLISALPQLLHKPKHPKPKTQQIKANISHNKPNKLPIIFPPYTNIQPFTMMIKILYTNQTFFTMLRHFISRNITNFTNKKTFFTKPTFGLKASTYFIFSPFNFFKMFGLKEFENWTEMNVNMKKRIISAVSE